jgi:primosomal protein N' (replication factor Y)
VAKKKVPEGLLADVAVMAAIRHPLTYRLPDSLPVRPGQRVQVPLGTRNVTGIVLRPVARTVPGIQVRKVVRVLDPEPALSRELLELGQWISGYYLAPLGEVFRAMLPLRAEMRRARLLRLTEAGKRKLEELVQSLLPEVQGSVESAFLRYLEAHPGASLESVRDRFPSLLDIAVRKRWVAIEEVERERIRRKTFAVRLAGPLPEKGTRLSPVARRILEVLDRAGPAPDHRPLLRSARADLQALMKAQRAGWIELSESRGPVIRQATYTGRSEEEALPSMLEPALELTAAQGAVLQDLSTRLEAARFEVVLLHGITGSGKTEIYLRLAGRCLERGRSVLMLVPEIALTPAVQAQFLARFGNQVALLHSGLSERERDEGWWRVRRGEARAVLGTRSAVFAPLTKLGLVIVDEEHDSGYKQEETPRYHGRDVAVVRARAHGALAILGSATPSLESYWNARQAKYHLTTLPERIAGRSLATVEIVDMRQEFRETHTQVPISRRLKEEIETQLRTSAQTMILLNRRGYSWFLLCRSCGQTQRCVNCSISLTYHRREHRLICHYCGYSAAIPARCPACASEYLYYVGEGTEKIEQKFAELFPGARVARLDRDVARRAGQYQRLLADFRQGKIDILVGTQLIAKGHDFPGVTLVGVVSADLGLGLPDFRAAERTFQLLTQAAGRAGRGDAPGRVLVQTFYPEHYAIRLAAEQNYAGFFSREMSFRKLMHYPPVTALANVIAEDTKLEQAGRVASRIGSFLTGIEGQSSGIKVLGPSPAPLARIEGRYRIQFLLKSVSRSRLNAVLQQLARHCEGQGIPPRAVMIDMDPISVM